MIKALTVTKSFLRRNKWTLMMFAVMALLVIVGPETVSAGFLKGQLFDPNRDLPDNLADAGGDSTLREIILLAVNFILGFVGLIAVIMLIYGGFVLLTSSGEEEKTKKAKSTILFAIIGIVIILFSFAIINTVFDITTGSDSTTGAV